MGEYHHRLMIELEEKTSQLLEAQDNFGGQVTINFSLVNGREGSMNVLDNHRVNKLKPM